MQPIPCPAPGAAVRAFQYPRSDRRRCNKPPPRAPRPPIETFSILGRIGGDATDPRPWGTVVTVLSFSILGRIGGDATTSWAGQAVAERPLSVSSVGSEAMQLGNLNLGLRAAVSFSILGRIGGDATDFPHLGCLRGMWNFQYPRSDRRRCNENHRDRETHGLLCFQYPRSDRRRCNDTRDDGGRNFNPTFSILGRIGGDATCRGGAAGIPRRLPFSILGRIGGDATLDEAADWLDAYDLSVSSVGSEAMQLSFSRKSTSHSQKLSVSSVGSEAMQRRPSSKKRPEVKSFSILGRIGGDATATPCVTRYSPTWIFQYPRSDRRRCNFGESVPLPTIAYLSVSSVGSEAMQPASALVRRARV